MTNLTDDNAALLLRRALALDSDVAAGVARGYLVRRMRAGGAAAALLPRCASEIYATWWSEELEVQMLHETLGALAAAP